MEFQSPEGAVARALLSAALIFVARAASCSVDAQDKCRCSESPSSLLDVTCYLQYPYAPLPSPPHAPAFGCS